MWFNDKTPRVEATSYHDRTITCVGSEATFVWTADGQRYFAERNFAAPRRCRQCRQAREQARARRGQYGQ